MAEHYPRNTVESREWCNKCNKATMHRIDGVRKGPCLECIARLDKEIEEKGPAQPAAKQDKLF